MRYIFSITILFSILIFGSGCLSDNSDYISLEKNTDIDTSNRDPEYRCDDNQDNDRDGSIDCDDDDCSRFPTCADPDEATDEQCKDGQDNDTDGKIDCDDEGCANFNHCTENNEAACSDNNDNDSDGLIDCLDPSCSYFPHCLERTENTLEMCKDKEDNDNNGTIDCDDEGCKDFAHCTETSRESCDDAIDNDLDGYTDCQDPGCSVYDFCRKPVENSPALCVDLLDNDNDGHVDCADSDCADFDVCDENSAKKCDNKIDDDGDGRIDCEDTGCELMFFCKIPPQDTMLVIGFKEELPLDIPYKIMSSTETTLFDTVTYNPNATAESELQRGTQELYSVWVHDPGSLPVTESTTGCIEGTTCAKLNFMSAGWEMIFVTFSNVIGNEGSPDGADGIRGYVDLSTWASTELKFWIKTTAAMVLDVKLEYKNRVDAGSVPLRDVGYNPSIVDWQEITIVLGNWGSRGKMRNMSLPFSISKLSGQGELWIDDVRYQPY